MPHLFLDPTFGAERRGPCGGVEGGGRWSKMGERKEGPYCRRHQAY